MKKIIKQETEKGNRITLEMPRPDEGGNDELWMSFDLLVGALKVIMDLLTEDIDPNG